MLAEKILIDAMAKEKVQDKASPVEPDQIRMNSSRKHEI